MNILQTILEGALGGLTFGIYHHYVTMREIKKFNEKYIKKYSSGDGRQVTGSF